MASLDLDFRQILIFVLRGSWFLTSSEIRIWRFGPSGSLNRPKCIEITWGGWEFDIVLVDLLLLVLVYWHRIEHEENAWTPHGEIRFEHCIIIVAVIVISVIVDISLLNPCRGLSNCNVIIRKIKTLMMHY